MRSHRTKSVSRILGGLLLAAVPVVLSGQGAAKASGSNSQSPSRWDIFAGYSYLGVHGTVDTPNPAPSTGYTPTNFRSITPGGILSIARYFNNYVGLEAIGDYHQGQEGPQNGMFHAGDDFSGGSGGLIFRFPTDTMTPFVHGLVGGEWVGGPAYQNTTPGIGLTAGGGLDYKTPWKALSIRLFQVDYQYAHVDWGPVSNASEIGGRGNANIARLSTGLVFHVGTIAPPPQLTVACAVNPTSVFPGDPVTATATAANEAPKENVVVSISGDGINGTTTGTTATVNTANLSPGQHTVKCDAKEGKAGHEGLKPYQNAQEATATFTVREFEPPTISCSANPTTLKPGDSSTITATGMSPQNRPLTYTYSASAGTINGSGNTATFSSTGAPTGPVTITCNVSDDKGHNASAETSVSIEAPPPPPQPKTQALCSITFTTDKKRPTRVDNEAKACLDQVALNLQQQPDAKAVVVGESDAKEKAEQEKMEKLEARRKHHKPVEQFAAQRAVNTKQYLVTDKGIDPSRITVATGTGDTQQVENYLVPAGANFSADVQGTTPVDENTVKPQERKPLAERHPAHHKKAAQ